MPEGKGQTKRARKSSSFKRQKIMERVLIALIPALLGSIYFFGWRSLAMVVWCAACASLIEYLFARRRGDPLTEAALVTSTLFALSLPPTLPFWMATVGIIIGILFGKEFFGGFGRNVFNPAIVGRAFIYTCFPIAMTSKFVPVWEGFWGGFAHYGPRTTVAGMDAVSTATPLYVFREFDIQVPLLDLFVGNIGGSFTATDGEAMAVSAGSLGEVSAVLVILGGIYLLWTKTANWRLVLSSMVGAAAAVVVFRHLFGVALVPSLPRTFFSGALLYACFFMVTDPVSAPKDRTAQYWYGALIGVLIVFMRWKAVFAGAVAFSILLGNTFGPTIEMMTKAYARRKKERRKQAAEGKGTASEAATQGE